MTKFDPQPTLNPWTDRHKIWNTSLRRGYLLPKNWAQSAQGILPPIYPKYTPKTFECLLHFFQFFRAPTEKAAGPIFALNTPLGKILHISIQVCQDPAVWQIWSVYVHSVVLGPLSHAHTVVWECCKDDRQSQWEMAKFDPQPTLNPWTDGHQIWNTWLGRGHIPPKNSGVNPARSFYPTHVQSHPKPSNAYCTFSGSSKPTQTIPLDRFSRFIRHTTWFCAW